MPALLSIFMTLAQRIFLFHTNLSNSGSAEMIQRHDIARRGCKNEINLLTRATRGLDEVLRREFLRHTPCSINNNARNESEPRSGARNCVLNFSQMLDFSTEDSVTESYNPRYGATIQLMPSCKRHKIQCFHVHRLNLGNTFWQKKLSLFRVQSDPTFLHSDAVDEYNFTPWCAVESRHLHNTSVRKTTPWSMLLCKAADLTDPVANPTGVASRGETRIRDMSSGLIETSSVQLNYSVFNELQRKNLYSNKGSSIVLRKINNTSPMLDRNSVQHSCLDHRKDLGASMNASGKWSEYMLPYNGGYTLGGNYERRNNWNLSPNLCSSQPSTSDQMKEKRCTDSQNAESKMMNAKLSLERTSKNHISKRGNVSDIHGPCTWPREGKFPNFLGVHSSTIQVTPTEPVPVARGLKRRSRRRDREKKRRVLSDPFRGCHLALTGKFLLPKLLQPRGGLVYRKPHRQMPRNTKDIKIAQCFRSDLNKQKTHPDKIITAVNIPQSEGDSFPGNGCPGQLNVSTAMLEPRVTHSQVPDDSSTDNNRLKVRGKLTPIQGRRTNLRPQVIHRLLRNPKQIRDNLTRYGYKNLGSQPGTVRSILPIVHNNGATLLKVTKTVASNHGPQPMCHSLPGELPSINQCVISKPDEERIAQVGIENTELLQMISVSTPNRSLSLQNMLVTQTSREEHAEMKSDEGIAGILLQEKQQIDGDGGESMIAPLEEMEAQLTLHEYTDYELHQQLDFPGVEQLTSLTKSFIERLISQNVEEPEMVEATGFCGATWFGNAICHQWPWRSNAKKCGGVETGSPCSVLVEQTSEESITKRRNNSGPTGLRNMSIHKWMPKRFRKKDSIRNIMAFESTYNQIVGEQQSKERFGGGELKDGTSAWMLGIVRNDALLTGLEENTKVLGCALDQME